MFVHLPQAEADIDQLIAEGKHNDALAHLVVGVHNSFKLPEWSHQALYYPGFDRQLQCLARALPGADAASGPPGRGTLVIATELYQVGGHSRVIADVMREVEQPTLVLTDLFSNYRKAPEQLQWVLQAYEHAPVIVLNQLTLWAKCRALLQLTQRLAPRSIQYFQHHQDPLPFVGTLAHRGSRKMLVHHCDVNPALGNTLDGVVHADFTAEQAGVCSRELGKPVSLLPLFVPDAGRKRFAPLQGGPVSVVTSGTHIKYARHGEVALQAIAQTVLTAVQGRFFHIGPIAADWVAEIHAHLQRHGIDPARFVALGPVPSVWQALAGLDAHVYLGSAPVAGGRGAIEAQGCGYPLLFYRVADANSLLAVDSIYASPQLGWRTLPELGELLAQIGPQLPQLSDAARALYEQRFSRQEFTRVLRDDGGSCLPEASAPVLEPALAA